MSSYPVVFTFVVIKMASSESSILRKQGFEVSQIMERRTFGLPGAVYDVRLSFTFCLLNDWGCAPHPRFVACKGYLINCMPCNFDRFKVQYGSNL